MNTIRLELPRSMASALAWAVMVGDPTRPHNILPYRYGGDGSKRPAVGDWIQWHGGAETGLKRQVPQLWMGWARYAKRSGIEAWATLPGALGVVVLDVDAPHLLGRALDRYGETPVYVTTPSGGYHLYYRAGDDAPSSFVGVLGPGTYDVKSRGGTSHAPGTRRPDGKRYVAHAPGLDDDGTLIVGTRPALPAGALYSLLPVFPADVLEEEWTAHHPAGSDMPCDGEPRYATTPGEVDAIRAYMRAAGPAIALQGGHEHTRKLLKKIGDLGASEALALQLALEWDETNEGPWGELEIRKKVRDAYRKRMSPIGWKLVHALDDDWNEPNDEPDAETLSRMLQDYDGT